MCFYLVTSLNWYVLQAENEDDLEDDDNMPAGKIPPVAGMKFDLSFP